MPSTARESSVVFSLNELMALEEQRLAEEAAAREAAIAAEAARARAERRAAEEAAERRRLAEEAAEEEARRLELQRATEERARLDALRAAELAKAERAVEAQARLEALALAQEHERKLAALKADRNARRLKFALVGNVVALFASAAVAALVLRHHEARHASERARWLDRLAAEERSATARSAAHEAELRVLRDVNQRLESRLAREAQPRNTLPPADPPAIAGQRRNARPAPVPPAKKVAPGTSCDAAHDPMCGTL
jgi:colicin import membrane protein